MELSRALGLGPREVVAFVGAGGKTTALYRLADLLRAQGRSVVATTTTHMWPPPAEAGWPLVVGMDAQARLRAVAQALAEAGRAFVGTAETPEGKLRGVGPGEVAGLAALADMVLVEADGARGLWLKAPAGHEPAIPAQASVVVPVASVRAIGQPLAGEAVHRPERVSDLLGLPMGATITEDVVARLLLHEGGGLRGVPPGARVIPLCNQADDEALRLAGRRIAAQVLRAGGRIERVVVGTMQEAATACERWAPSAAVVLAAGPAKRYGRLKQAEVWEGRPFLVRAVEAALSSLASQALVVLGCQAEGLAPLLAELGSPRLRQVVNPAWAEGQASSVRAALEALPDGTEAAIFCTADQPLLSAREIDALLARHALGGAPIVAPSYRGELRSPVLFGRPLFPELAALEGDTGGRAVVWRHRGEAETVEVADPRPYADVDTEDDYRRLHDGGR